MAKRFTDTNKYKKPFIRSLQGAYKLLWDYLYHECDHAGIWIVDFDIAQIYIGVDMPINKKNALEFFNSDETRIIEIDNGKKWFLPGFIEFQYGELNPQNRAHNSVINILKKYNLGFENKGLVSPLQGAMDKDKDKDKDMVKGGTGGSISDFGQFLLTDEIWQMSACKALSLTKEKLIISIKNFIDLITAAPHVYKDLNDCKSHFINWHKKNNTNGKLKTAHPELKRDEDRQSTEFGNFNGKALRFGEKIQENS